MTTHVRLRREMQFVTFDFQHGYSEWRNLEYGKEYETAKPQFGIAVL